MAQYQHLYLYSSKNMNFPPPHDDFRFWNFVLLNQKLKKQKLQCSQNFDLNPTCVPSPLKPKVCFVTFLYESRRECLIINQTLIFCVFNHGPLINPSPREAAYWSSFHRHHSCLIFVILDSLSITIEEKYVTLMHNGYMKFSTSILSLDKYYIL